MPITLNSRWNQFDIGHDEADPISVAAALTEQSLYTQIRRALANHSMRLAFQPAVYSADPSIIGFYEGYIRLLNADGTLIPARDFAGVFETHELGREIDVAALRLGLGALLRNPGVRIAVNMSARSVGYKPWGQLLRETLRSSPEIGPNLILEINEESAMQMPDVLLPFMDEMRDFGVAFTLDDFGAGRTSLQVLADLQFDIAKIDSAFIRNCHLSSVNQQIALAAIAMGRALDMFLVAEAVEHVEEANWLRENGVGCMQGYLFGRPEIDPDFSLYRKARNLA